MDFEFSADQELLRETVRRFLAERAPLSYVRARLDDDRGTSDEVWAGLAALGVTGLLVPEEHGGAGMGMVEMGVVLEEMGRAAQPGPFRSSALDTVALVRAVATAGEADELLPSLAAGTRVGTVALLEPGHRYDWRSPETKGGPTLTGTKTHVPDGLAADLLLVVARADDGLSVFSVDRDAPGLEVTALPTIDGTSKQATVVLRDTPARRLGSGDATDEVAAAVDLMLVGLAVDGVGAAEQALALAVDYAKARVQFDRPLGSFQAVQHLCAEMLQAVELARAAAYYALWAADSASPGERHRAAVMAKAYASDALPRVGAATIQVFGGIGFTWEHDAHLYYKRLLSLQRALGSPGDHLEQLAALVLD